MHILITTPKPASQSAAAEAASCINNGGGYYFRSFGKRPPKDLKVGDKIFYVDNDYITGYAVVHALVDDDYTFTCDVTNRVFRGSGAIMRADSWRWIKRVKCFGFQGFRYFNGTHVDFITGRYLVEEIGGWLDPKPRDIAEMVEED